MGVGSADTSFSKERGGGGALPSGSLDMGREDAFVSLHIQPKVGLFGAKCSS